MQEAYELFKGWNNAFWWNLATAKPIIDKEGKEIIDFRYDPKRAKANKKKWYGNNTFSNYYLLIIFCCTVNYGYYFILTCDLFFFENKIL